MRPTGKTVTHSRGPWSYRDRYVGSRDFAGFEVVSFEGDPVWGMSYYGHLADGADRGDVYAFLRAALRRPPEETPVRGPAEFREGDRSYRATVHGSIERFSGRETIRRDGADRYRGQFGGEHVE